MIDITTCCIYMYGGGGGDFSQCNKLKHKLFELVDYIIIKQLM